MFWLKTELKFDMENAYGLERVELMKLTGFSSQSSSAHQSYEAKPPSLLWLMAPILSLENMFVCITSQPGIIKANFLKEFAKIQEVQSFY